MDPIGYIVTKDGTPWMKGRGRTSGCTKMFKDAHTAELEINSRLFSVRDDRITARARYAIVPVRPI